MSGLLRMAGFSVPAWVAAKMRQVQTHRCLLLRLGLLTSADVDANKRSGSQWRSLKMIRKIGIAAVLGLALAAPAHEATAQNSLGGALLGGAAGAVVGGAVGGGRGAAIGAVIGAGTGAAIASEGERRRGSYYWYHGGCYVEGPDGWIRVDRRYCY
jgi:outer membrane lipoprotein SlyB